MELLWIIPMCTVAALVIINLTRMVVTTSDVVTKKYLNYIDPKESIKEFAMDDVSIAIEEEVERRVDIEVAEYIKLHKQHQA